MTDHKRRQELAAYVEKCFAPPNNCPETMRLSGGLYGDGPTLGEFRDLLEGIDALEVEKAKLRLIVEASSTVEAQMKRGRDAVVTESAKQVTEITGLANELLDVRRVLQGEPQLNRFELPEMLANALAAKDEALENALAKWRDADTEITRLREVLDKWTDPMDRDPSIEELLNAK